LLSVIYLDLNQVASLKIQSKRFVTLILFRIANNLKQEF